MVQQKKELPEIVAFHTAEELQINAASLSPQWGKSPPISFARDWQGNNPDSFCETQVRILWSHRMLYIRFECHYRELFVFPDSEPSGHRDYLWDRDVAEAFLQPDPTQERHYREFEVSPNGMWIDLDIFPGGRSDLQSGLSRSVFLDEKAKQWNAELAIPMNALTRKFDPQAVWRANFFRVEGKEEPRSYFAWQPTGTSEPNFHVPKAFGYLRFGTSPG